MHQNEKDPLKSELFTKQACRDAIVVYVERKSVFCINIRFHLAASD